jgi:hypothetical protein
MVVGGYEARGMNKRHRDINEHKWKVDTILARTLMVRAHKGAAASTPELSTMNK